LNRFAKFDFPRTDFFPGQSAGSQRSMAERPPGGQISQAAMWRGKVRTDYDDVKVRCAFGAVSAAIA